MQSALSQKVTKVEIALDAILNVFIIFTFLTLFYYFFAFDLEKNSLEKELRKAIDASVEELDNTQTRTLAVLQTNMETLKASFAGPDASTQSINRYLFIIAAMVCAATLCVLLAIVVTLYSFNIPLKKMLAILFKNIWIFSVVAPLEYIFFVTIAHNFIPVPSTELQLSIIQAMQSVTGVKSVVSSCPQKSIGCSDVWPCVNRNSVILYASIAGALLLGAILAVSLAPSSQAIWSTVSW